MATFSRTVNVGNKNGEANALVQLGGVQYDTGEYAAAAASLRRALALHHALGTRNGQANALYYLGAVQVATLDHMSNGRILLGIGVGWLKEEFDAIGATFENRGRRTAAGSARAASQIPGVLRRASPRGLGHEIAGKFRCIGAAQ